MPTWVATAVEKGGVATLLIALLAWVLVLIFTGRLRPGRYVEELRQDHDARAEDLKEQVRTWKSAYELEAQGRREFEQTSRESLELSRTIVSMLESVHRTRQRQGR